MYSNSMRWPGIMTAVGEAFFEWREAQLKHADGRAKGGESCVVCCGAVPPNAAWQHRDRHVCSSRCNATLVRRFTTKARRDKAPIPVEIDPYADREAMLFKTDESLDWPYGFLGLSPRDGDIVERHGSHTSYERMTWADDGVEFMVQRAAESEEPNRTRILRLLERGMICAHHESGSQQWTFVDDNGTLTRTLDFTLLPDGTVASHYRQPFSFEGRDWIWTSETIRHAEGDDDYSWHAVVCLPYPPPARWQHQMWTPEYAARSERLTRISDHTARNARRVRMVGPEGVIERIDPVEIYERDGWVCQLCMKPIDRALTAPDRMSASLDHRVPLVAGGGHTASNVQASHLICNIRKGARF
jgi:hypothetical protein